MENFGVLVVQVLEKIPAPKTDLTRALLTLS